MEPAPLNEDLHSNENYFKPSQFKKQNNDILNVNDFFIEQNEQHLNTNNNNFKDLENINKFIIQFSFYPLLSILISLSILLGTILLFTLLIKLEMYQRILILISGIIIIIILNIFTNNRLEITKNELDNKVNIKLINLLCFTKKKIILYRENTHFFIKCKIDSKDNINLILIIINDYQNLIDIDLDTSNIKCKPAKFYYYFNNISPKNSYI